jgi:hypothetical protein
MITRRNIVKMGAMAVIGLTVAGTIAISEARPKKIVKKGQHSGIYQHALKHHKHAKHVMCDTKTGNVVWTFHDGNTVTFVKGHLPGSFNRRHSSEFTSGDHYSLSKLSEKIRVWCPRHGTVFPGGVEP